MARVLISSKGQITLPVALRRQAGLDLHDPVVVVAEGDHLLVRKAGNILDWRATVKARPRSVEKDALLDAAAGHVRGRGR